MTKIKNYFSQSAKTINNLYYFQTKIDKITQLILKCYHSKQKIFVGGNGGSSSDGDHFVGELQCTFDDRKRPAIPAISLNNNTASLTAWSNDFKFETFYERQIKALGTMGDILILLSTSGGKKRGQSSNLVLAAKAATRKKIKVISLVGKKGGELKKMSDICIHIKNNNTAIIQQSQMAILHYICSDIDKKINAK